MHKERVAKWWCSEKGSECKQGRGKNWLSCIFQTIVPQVVVVGVAALKGAAAAAVAATVAARVATM